MEKMSEEQLDHCKKFLDYMDVDYSGDSIMLTSGGNGIIMNSKSQWYESFGGHSINGVAREVAEELGKKTTWEDEGYCDSEY